MIVERRRFLLLILAANAKQVGAQQRTRRVAILGMGRDWRQTKEIVARLGELGYSEGRNLAIEAGFSPERPGEFTAFAREFVRQRVDVIVACGVMAIIAARDTTSSIPIVMVYGGDPVALGFVGNLAKPGGNVTGLGWGDDVQFTAKLVELVRAALPAAKTIGVIHTRTDRAFIPYLRALAGAATALGFRLEPHGVDAVDDVPKAFDRMKAERSDAVLVLLDHVTLDLQDPIEQAAAARRMPLITWPGFGYDNAMLRFGPKVRDQTRRAAEYVARILDGARPGDLPVDRSFRYELVVNLKTAKALGISIPEPVLLRADSVIR